MRRCTRTLQKQVVCEQIARRSAHLLDQQRSSSGPAYPTHPVRRTIRPANTDTEQAAVQHHAPPSAPLRHRRDERLAAAPTKNHNTDKTIRHRPLAARAESATAARGHAGLGRDEDGQADILAHHNNQRRRLRRLRAASAAHAQLAREEDSFVNWELRSSENSTRSAGVTLLRGRLEHLYRSIRAAGGGAPRGVCGGVLRAVVTGAARFGVRRPWRT